MLEYFDEPLSTRLEFNYPYNNLVYVRAVRMSRGISSNEENDPLLWLLGCDVMRDNHCAIRCVSFKPIALRKNNRSQTCYVLANNGLSYEVMEWRNSTTLEDPVSVIGECNHHFIQISSTLPPVMSIA